MAKPFPRLEIPRSNFGTFFEVLRQFGYCIVGPTVHEGAIIYDELSSVDDLPVGWTDVQEPGKYRLKKREDRALFGFTVGPHSWKKYLFPPERRLWQADRRGKSIDIQCEKIPKTKYAFLGVRACELHALFIQDKVFLEGDAVDPYYEQVRKNSLVVAINCGQSGGTCFCVSMNTGPRVTEGYDLVLTEVLSETSHSFFLEPGSDKGNAVAKATKASSAPEASEKIIEEIVRNAAQGMGRSLNTDGIKELLYANLSNPRWEEVAQKCLSCANCTLACPTCFCSTVEETTDLTGDHAERWKKWDSCFTSDFSYIHGGSIRTSTLSRYRQWMTHKLASWWDQFGSSGCVGCGRCITWCPVGIDITEEANAIRLNPVAEK